MFLVTTILIEKVSDSPPTFHGALTLKLETKEEGVPPERYLDLAFQAASKRLIFALAIRDGERVLHDAQDISDLSHFVEGLCKNALDNDFATQKFSIDDLRQHRVLEQVLELCHRKKVYSYVLVCILRRGEIIGRLELAEPVPLAVGDRLDIDFDAVRPRAQLTHSKRHIYGRRTFVIDAITTDGVPMCAVDESVLN